MSKLLNYLEHMDKTDFINYLSQFNADYKNLTNNDIHKKLINNLKTENFIELFVKYLLNFESQENTSNVINCIYKEQLIYLQKKINKLHLKNPTYSKDKFVKMINYY